MKKRSPITTHVLDLTSGRPAAAIPAVLEFRAQGAWLELGRSQTDADGRIEALLPEDHKLAPGEYRIRFETADYLKSRHSGGFYPRVSIDFTVQDPGQHYHVPLLLSPYGYSTYRGS